jgi:protein-disulfide isomerase
MSRSVTRSQRRREAKRAQQGRQQRRPRGAGLSRTQLMGASVIAVLAVAALIWAGTAGSNTPATTLPPSITQSGHTRGEASAPVTIEEWADFQCPACGQFARITEPALLSTYVSKGQVRIVFHHFAFLGLESSWAAEASECAAEQGKFFEYHDKLFASQAGENKGAFSKDNLKRFGTELGLGPNFASCVDSGRYAQAVRDDTKVGEGRGVQATPTLFVNGRKIEYAATIDQLRAVIDPILTGR